jgi:2-dehydropantoate 2-reductase
MRIAVFGTGGVGGYFGGRLAQAGEAVTFIARGDHLRAIREHGLRVDSLQGDFVIQPAQATADPARLGPVDVVILGVKAWQVREAAEAMRPLVGPETFVVPLQNGVEAPDELASVLGREHVLGGFCRIIALIAGPGHIRHAGGQPYVAFGELDNRRTERVELLRAAFSRAAGLTVEVPADIRAAMWEKFLTITSFSGVGAVTRAPIGVIRSVPQTREMMVGVMREIIAVANARGIPLGEDAVQRVLAFRDSLPPASTASMQRDIMDGRPSELEWQSGAVVRLGREVGVESPLNAFIYHSLLPQELKARGKL